MAFVLVVACVSLIGGAVVAALSSAGGSMGEAAVAVGGLVAGLALLALMAARYEWFLLLLIISRISLDVFQFRGVTAGTVVAGIFSLAVVLRLVQRFRTGALRRPSALTMALLGLSAAAFLSAAFSVYKVDSALAALQILAGSLMFLALEQELPGRPQFARRVVAAALASAVVPFLVGTVQVLTNTGNHDTAGFNRVMATAVHPTPFATYLLIIVPAALALAAIGGVMVKRGTVLAVVGAWLLFNTYTRASWIAAAVAVLYLAVGYRRRLLIPIIVGGVIVAVALPSLVSDRFADVTARSGLSYDSDTNSLVWRVNYWGELLTLADGQEATGIGLEVTQRETRQRLQPHNVFVQAYVEMGAVGAASLAGVVVAYFLTVLRRRKGARTTFERAAAVAMGTVGVALLVQGATSNVMTQTMFYWYAAAITAFGYRASSPSAMPTSHVGTRSPVSV